MMKQLISAAVLLICTTATAQQYTIGHTSAEMKDTQRGNRKIRVEIYYPESKAKTVQNEDVVRAVRFPVICFAHGYMMSPDVYGNIRKALVPEGFILVFPYTGTGMFPSHQAFSEDLAFVLSATEKMAGDPGSPLYGITDTVFCLMGHSMGGGALFAAANIYKRAAAVIALAPLNSKPSAIKAAASVETPTLIIAGENDCITPPGRNQIPIYDNASTSDKTFIMIMGGTHCGMADSSTVCTLIGKLSGCSKGSSAEEQHQIGAKYLVPWLDYFLKGDMKAGKLFNMTMEGDAEVEYMRSHPLLTGCGR